MSEKHTICLLNDSFPPVIDGVANAVLNYAKNIEAHHGHSVVVTPSVPGAEDEGYSFPVIRYPSIDTRKLVGYVTGYPFSPETARRLQDEHTALLHTHCPVASTILARELRDVLDAPLVLTYHTKFDIDIAKAIKGKLMQAGTIHALVQNISACDEVWVVSEGAGENLRSLGYEGDYTVMANGVDVPRGGASAEAVEAATAGLDLPGDMPMFLFVGRLMWYKGLRLILDALAALKEKGTDYRMVFVGDGGDGKEVREYASSLGLDKVCFFTGAISDREAIRAWYTRADLFLFPSTFDTNGLVVREAAASGTATVMVAGSCAAEGVTDGQNGFFIEENAESLAAKLTELCGDREAMRRVGENAERELYLSWEDAVKNACERYETVIDNYRSGRYPAHKKPMDGYLKSQGELMDTLAMIESASDEAWSEILADRDEMAARFHESQEEVRKYFRERQRRARENRERVTEHIEELWRKMDRYG